MFDSLWNRSRRRMSVRLNSQMLDEVLGSHSLCNIKQIEYRTCFASVYHANKLCCSIGLISTYLGTKVSLEGSNLSEFSPLKFGGLTSS